MRTQDASIASSMQCAIKIEFYYISERVRHETEGITEWRLMFHASSLYDSLFEALIVTKPTNNWKFGVINRLYPIIFLRGE